MLERGTGLVRFDTPAEGLAAEMALLDAVAAGGTASAVLVWQTKRSLVVPGWTANRAGFEAAAQRSAAAGWPVAVRATGGGATPQGPGILNLAVAFAASPRAGVSVRGSYEVICRPIASVLRGLGLRPAIGAVEGSFCDGAFNLALGGRKVVGTAQRWRRRASGGHAILAHALILVDGDNAARVAAIARLNHAVSLTAPLRIDAHTTVRAALGRAAGERLAGLPQALLAALGGEAGLLVAGRRGRMAARRRGEARDLEAVVRPG